ncbi:citrate transporter [Capnocytophaga sp. oral taxon 863 str. F0517]|uniref:sodium:proton antiporter NhaD n=1 Tax=Capnocytophaga sp. oral taxon 863 TaxID=1227265 RepID=UPI0003963F34|nr:sodium:proton antiporter NhaD [Capnocytophaga sp. oral taxon 863]ERI62117.1 citrate transporter [Capnocytophaga sp. oral taxon 863 str. F0517]
MALEFLIVAVFFIGYLFITVEHQVKIDKTISALGMAVICWTILKTADLPVFKIQDGLVPLADQYAGGNQEAIDTLLLHHLGEVAEILFFLIGAMTIVEIIDMHRGFEIIKKMVKTRRKKKLLWVLGIVAFFLSALIDNLTTIIIMITILRKLVPFREERIWYASLLIIAANAGGAWSPIGDVTTTMLWMANKVTAMRLIDYVVLPAVLCFLVPFAIASVMPIFKGKLDMPRMDKTEAYKSSTPILIIGVLAIIFVPVFKSIFHLPPYLGMLFSLATVWFFSELLKPNTELVEGDKPSFSVHSALGRIEHSSILFFLGILLAVASLEVMGTLFNFAGTLSHVIPNENIVVMILGFASAVIDNVPLVAAAIGMFQEPLDAAVWHFIAFSAGTGGSLLIIGSAAGVAAMGMEKIDFFWYVKHISWLALIGFLAGSGALIAVETWFR